MSINAWRLFVTLVVTIFASLLVVVGLPSLAGAQAKERRSWTVEDSKKLKSFGGARITGDGKWLATQLRPPRTGRGGRRGPQPEGEATPERTRPQTSLLLFDVASGEKKKTLEGVSAFRFSPDSEWLIYTKRANGNQRPDSDRPASAEKPKPAEAKSEGKPEAETGKTTGRSARWRRMMERLKARGGGEPEEPTAEPTAEPTTEPTTEPTAEPTGRRGRRGRGDRGRRGGTSTLVLSNLTTCKDITIANVGQYTLSQDGAYLFYVTSKREGEKRENTLWVREMKKPDDARKIDGGEATFASLRWQKKLATLWFQSNRTLEETPVAATVRAGPAPTGATSAALLAKPEDHAPMNDRAWGQEEEEEEKEKKKAAKGQEKKAGRPAAQEKKKAAAVARETAKTEAAESKATKTEVETEASEGDDEEKKEPETPREPSRIWSYSPKTGELKPLVGPGVGVGFPEGEVLSGGGGGRGRGRGGITPEMMARFRGRMRGFGGMGMMGGGGGVTLAKDLKRLFVRTQKPAPRPERPRAGSENEPESGARATRRGGRGGRTGRTTATTSGNQSRREQMMARFGGRFGRGETGGRRTGRGRSRAESNKPEVVVWHWQDTKIPPEAARSRNRRSSETTLWEVDLATGKHRKVMKSDRRASFSPDQSWMLDYDSKPYTKLTSWDRSYSDVYAMSVATGERKRIFEKFTSRVQWTEDCRWMIWFEDKHWHRLDPQTGERKTLTKDADMHYAESTSGGRRGMRGAPIQHRDSLLITDSHDVWRVPLSGGVAVNLTKVGRRDNISLRPVALGSGDTAAERYMPGGVMLLSSFNNRTKAAGYMRLDVNTGALTKLIEMDKRIGTPVKAKNADVIHFTMEGSDQCSDVWVSDTRFENMRRVTDANPWLRDLNLPKNMLVEWRNLDGEPLQGILTLPAGYKSGKRYPLIVYVYEKLSQNLNRFKAPGLVYNVPMWAASGYAVLQPDITYEIGHPGQSSLKCVLPAVDKIVDMGIADNDRVGLIGHSWGGYETSYIITQTKRFAAAVSGAPVVNMTSAYNGVRWQTGKPRQFQYERTQSRIGGSLWEYPERFIENSPIFHLEKQTTPVLILFGDEDGAVPWWQGVEYMLALRRLGKPGVFLQYKNEGHGLRREANKKDYDKRVMEWFNHYLRDQKAPDWIAKPQH